MAKEHPVQVVQVQDKIIMAAEAAVPVQVAKQAVMEKMQLQVVKTVQVAKVVHTVAAKVVHNQRVQIIVPA